RPPGMLKKNLTDGRSSHALAVVAGTPVAISPSRPRLARARPAVASRSSARWVVGGVVALVLGCGAPSAPSSGPSSLARSPSPGSLTPLTVVAPTRHAVASQSLSLLLPEAV